jgi:hypothetical protein
MITSAQKAKKEVKLDNAAFNELAKRKAELSGKILALKAESAKIASQLILGGKQVPACW